MTMKRPWTEKWLRENKAQLVFESSHHSHPNKMVGIYLVPAAGLVLRYRVEGSDYLEMDDLFIPAGGRVNSIAKAEADLDEYLAK